MVSRVLIGVPTYNSKGRLAKVFDSIISVTPLAQLERCKLVGLDDGSPSETARQEAEFACVDYGAEFIQHETNMGIPRSWNDLASFCEADIVVLFNDDIEVVDKNWLTAMEFFLEKNEVAGSVGWPTVNKDPRTGEVYFKDTIGSPGACGAPVGCCFAFRQKDYEAVGGFWNELISFYEEIDFGFKMYEIGKRNYMLPWPAMIHWHSQTFAKNPELAVVEIDGVRQSRMDRARRMFAEKWGCQDKENAPQNELHERFVTPLDDVELVWLTPQGERRGRVK